MRGSEERSLTVTRTEARQGIPESYPVERLDWWERLALGVTILASLAVALVLVMLFVGWLVGGVTTRLVGG